LQWGHWRRAKSDTGGRAPRPMEGISEGGSMSRLLYYDGECGFWEQMKNEGENEIKFNIIQLITDKISHSVIQI